MVAVCLCRPKFRYNVGAALRACACFGVNSFAWTGSRCEVSSGQRLPREERIKDYQVVNTVRTERPFDVFRGLIPIAVEFRNNAEPLVSFEHPKDALYIFGPEDGNIPHVYLQHCHRFVKIPSKFCLNLAAAVNIVLYDRIAKGG